MNKERIKLLNTLLSEYYAEEKDKKKKLNQARDYKDLKIFPVRYNIRVGLYGEQQGYKQGTVLVDCTDSSAIVSQWLGKVLEKAFGRSNVQHGMAGEIITTSKNDPRIMDKVIKVIQQA